MAMPDRLPIIFPLTVPITLPTIEPKIGTGMRIVPTMTPAVLPIA